MKKTAKWREKRAYTRASKRADKRSARSRSRRSKSRNQKHGEAVWGISERLPSQPFLQLLSHWQPPQSDRKVIPFKPFQSNRRAKAEMESVA